MPRCDIHEEERLETECGQFICVHCEAEQINKDIANGIYPHGNSNNQWFGIPADPDKSKWVKLPSDINWG